MGEFNLTYYEAIGKVLQDGGFIQGEGFASGVYVTEDKGTGVLVIKDANHMHIKLMEFAVSRNLMGQKYRYLEIATLKTLAK